MNISDKAKNIIDNCRFCWMCRHICPIGNATGLERNTARARALSCSMVVRGAEDIKEVVDNLYECTLCGACTNNCLTGWDPKVFITEVKTQAVLAGVTPKYILDLIEKQLKDGNVYGKKACSCLDKVFGDHANGDTLLYFSTDAVINTPESVKNATLLLEKANVNFALNKDAVDSGATMWFLTGKTEETLTAMKKCAEKLNAYKKVVVYDPIDLKLFLHEYKEYGIEIKAELVSFNAFVLELLEGGKIKAKKSNKEYTIQDNYAYARDLDDVDTARKIVDFVGVNKEMLLHGKEANMAGSLIMNEYMPDIQKQVALDRFVNAKNSDCTTIVTENPAEYVMLKNNCIDGIRVISLEEMILENF